LTAGIAVVDLILGDTSPFPGEDGGDWSHAWLIKTCQQEKPCQ
jgi:hypothetical protein